MKLAVIVNKDGPNLFIENIVKELINRKHEVKIFAMFNDENSVRMFTNMGLPIYDFEEMTQDEIDKVDCLFCPVQALGAIKYVSKYIFSFCNMNPKFDEVRGGDFVFTLSSVGENRIGGKAVEAFATMPIGLPKNDTPLKEEAAESNRILVIDSGHFPFAQKGKEQVAEMILEIAREFPDHEVCVKPRWLRDCDASAMTHVNTVHLYDLIEEKCNHQLPENLNLLEEHVDLQELIDSSKSVVSLCTTAYLDVALRGKGLLIARGVENEDMYQVRADYFNRVYDYAEKSGCVVDFRDVCKYLPEGKVCDPEHLKETFTYREGVSAKAVEVMEYIFDNFISKKKFVKIAEYDYENYKDTMVDDPTLSISKLKGNRLFVQTGGVIAQCRSISVNIDWEPFWEWQYKKCKKADKKSSQYSALSQKIKRAKSNYLIENKEQLMLNPIDRGYLYEALFSLKRYDELYEYKEVEGFDSCGFNYFCGLAHYMNKNYYATEIYLRKYMDEVLDRPYQKYLVERDSYKRKAFRILMTCYAVDFKYKELYDLVVQYMAFVQDDEEKGLSDNILKKTLAVVLEDREGDNSAEMNEIKTLYDKVLQQKEL